ncbi:hypothetical protein HK104_003338 [Borealophlyctis nickersoniae]|nr:hypothetical protein HK104_003338 [Borealophlyctis nickersoniae]
MPHQGNNNFVTPTYVSKWISAARSRLIGAARKTWSRSLHVWRTVPPGRAPDSTTWPFIGRPDVEALNEMGRYVAKSEGLKVVDWDRVVEGRQDLLRADGYHQDNDSMRLLWNMLFHEMERKYGGH